MRSAIAHSVQPMPGQVVIHTLRTKLQELESGIEAAQASREQHAAELHECTCRIAELKAARAELASFLSAEALN